MDGIVAVADIATAEKQILETGLTLGVEDMLAMKGKNRVDQDKGNDTDDFELEVTGFGDDDVPL